MTLPGDYLERVYAGVLGKLVGVYLGRPFEGWTYQRILRELGEIQYYVHDRFNLPLVVTDDDIAGTFTFLRALEDYGLAQPLTSRAVGQAWLNYLIEHQTILWWGGRGNSTEHTAYTNLVRGIDAPESGSAAVNGQVIAEQIGAQIFIDGWAMICPGDPYQAAEYAALAGRVSHDGEAVYAAQLLAAMEAAAFGEDDIDRLIETGLSFIPAESQISRMVQQVRGWVAQDGDWHVTRQRIEKAYGYDKFGGYCHVVPNHALIHLGLIYGAGDFQRSLSIVNTSGWDTDCNSG
ncbi:MAG: ADP-ribosylglycohydrolase family protein, partial [Chloroflexi bacterium]